MKNFKNPNPLIRSCIQSDIPTILEFIHKKATFDEKLSGAKSVILTDSNKIQLTMFGDRPFAQSLFALVDDVPIGFALFYFRYSSFKGRPNLWLDDLFLDEEARGHGAGLLLMRHLASIAAANNCTHLAWSAYANNHRGVKFYEGLNAKITDQKDMDLSFHLDEESVIRLAKMNL